MNDPNIFLPRPRSWSETQSRWQLPARISIRAPSPPAEPRGSVLAIRWLEMQLRSLQLEPWRAGEEEGIGGGHENHEERGGGIALRWEPLPDGGDFGAQAYRLRISSDGVVITAADELGLFYGAVTLGQWLRHWVSLGEGRLREIPGLEVEDEPSFPVRGVMLDVSRDKVPTLETLFSLVDRFADWKINQLQLYFEHTFAYQGHEKVWREASPYTPEDIRSLDGYCRERGVELVPNQNSFGHFHRWLRHEPYRRLAEVPEGVKHPFGEELEPFSLCPGDPGSLALLEDLYDQLLPQFGSRLFNVGCDETFDLGLGRSKKACEDKGKETVYVEFLHQVNRLVTGRGHRMQFWGDIIVQRPELISRLPGEAIALEWGYEGNHPFAEHGAHFAASGLDFYVCPGTSSWNSLGGRSENTVTNLSSASLHGQAHGAVGYLITDWGDFGHLQPLPASYLGFAVGANLAWNTKEAARITETSPSLVVDLLDRHVFASQAPGLGQILYDLGNIYLLPGAVPKNGSALFFLLTFPQDTLEHGRFKGLSEQGLERSRQALRKLGEKLGESTGGGPEIDLVRQELSWVVDLLALGADLGSARLLAAGPRGDRDQPLEAIPLALRQKLAERIEPLLLRHSRIWRSRNRPGGLEDSQQRLRSLREKLHPALEPKSAGGC